MSKKLVAYFSASGVTGKVAKTLAIAINADLFQIEPVTPYTDADLNWNDPQSRSSVEMQDKTFRPQVKNKVEKMEDYDTIFVGFPIWWYVAPTIINTFLESYDFSGKKIILFATSGGSGFGNTKKEIQFSAPDAILTDGKLCNHMSKKEIEEWIQSF